MQNYEEFNSEDLEGMLWYANDEKSVMALNGPRNAEWFSKNVYNYTNF